MKKLCLLLLTCISWFTTTAQETTAAGFAPTSEENALLWEISDNGLKVPSYLYGTIHMINKVDFIMTEQTKSAFEKAKLVVFEINLEEMSDMSVMMPLMMQAFMKGDTTLEDLLSEEDYKTVNNHFEKLGLPAMFLNRIKPMFLSALSSEDAMKMQDGQGEIVSYELEFMEMARKQGKTVGGLESAEYQMSMFDSIPYKVQAEMLLQSINTGGEDDGDDQFQQMVDLYKAQDLYGLQKMLADDDGVGKYGDLLLNRRNQNWIPIMEKIMAEQRAFFAVGAGHLSGEQGVITLLRQKGYTVKPIRGAN